VGRAVVPEYRESEVPIGRLSVVPWLASVVGWLLSLA
jgi:hypothetical protein